MADKNKVYYGEYTLKHWIDLILTENIILPGYQRYFVWDKDQSQSLVDSLIDNQFVPPVTIGSFVESGSKQNLILDGQQRLTSLLLHYLKVFPKRDQYKVNPEEIKLANENDDENEDDIDFIDWNFTHLLKLIKGKNLRERLEIHDAAIAAGYEDMPSSIAEDSFENSFLGFSFIVPASVDGREQQKFYSKVFRSINIEGKKLLPLESRAALYYLNSDMVGLFSPEFTKKITVKNDGKMDFVRYLSMLSQYSKNNDSEKVARGFTKNMERYYENFIYAVVDDKETKEFAKLSSIINGLEYGSRVQKLTNVIEGMKLIQNYDSIINMDAYMFGIIYTTIFRDKEIKSDGYEDLKNRINALIEKYKGNPLHYKNPSALKHLKLRIQESINVCKEFEA